MNWGEDLAATRLRYGDSLGIVDAEGRHTIAQVIDRAAGIADRLRDLGLGPNDFVATVFHNSALAASASYGVQLAGAAEVPINPLLGQSEIAHALACSGARFILVDGATGRDASRRTADRASSHDGDGLARRGSAGAKPHRLHQWYHGFLEGRDPQPFRAMDGHASSAFVAAASARP
jgi:acyl-CoA synthetase (AMP-forming)/AMP-acid ligase II